MTTGSPLPEQPALAVLVTCPGQREAASLAAALVEERLAACVNQLGPIRSTYRWEGQVENAEEYLLIIKTSQDRYLALQARIQALHAYSVPEIIALPIAMGSAAYLNWVFEMTR